MSPLTAGLIVLAALEGLVIFCILYTLREAHFIANESAVRHHQFVEGLLQRHHTTLSELVERHDTELNLLLDRIQAPEATAASAPMRLSPYPAPDPNKPPTHTWVSGRAGVGRIRVPIDPDESSIKPLMDAAEESIG